MNYFDTRLIIEIERIEKQVSIQWRKTRHHIFGFLSSPKKGLFFKAGDILQVVFEKGGNSFYFEGICLSIRFRRLVNKQATFLLRNIIMGVGIELTLSYYYNRLYRSIFLDYKRKQFYYKKHRLYYLRHRVNRETKINF